MYININVLWDRIQNSNDFFFSTQASLSQASSLCTFLFVLKAFSMENCQVYVIAPYMRRPGLPLKKHCCHVVETQNVFPYLSFSNSLFQPPFPHTIVWFQIFSLLSCISGSQSHKPFANAHELLVIAHRLSKYSMVYPFDLG